MWLETPIYAEDLDSVEKTAFYDWETFRGKTFFITGGTGLIGSGLINVLAYADKKRNLGLHIIALARNISSAKNLFEALLACSDCLEFAEGSIESFPHIDRPVDFIIHAASPTASGYFATHPVETVTSGIAGTLKTLELAKEKKSEGYIYLSSMEAYGAPPGKEHLSEDAPAFFSTMDVRSCYPEVKRLSENLCACYAQEYNINAKAIRLAQTFGAGIPFKETRVFAQFAKAALHGENIELHTKGESKHCYLYTMDAVTAILTVLLKGDKGRVYNAANPSSYCSIYDMAQLVADKLCESRIKVVVHEEKELNSKYPKTHNIKMNIDAISQLGWKPMYSLEDAYTRMLAGMKSEGIW